MTHPVIDIFMVYQMIKRLVQPYDQMDAFKYGLIDANGKRVKKATTPAEKRSLGYFDRMILNLKRLLGTIPLGRTRLATFAAALLLLKEHDTNRYVEHTVEDLQESFNDAMEHNESLLEWLDLTIDEDAPANATGSAVAGTGDDPVHWSRRQPRLGLKGTNRKYGQPIDATAFLRRWKKKASKD